MLRNNSGVMLIFFETPIETVVAAQNNADFFATIVASPNVRTSNIANTGKIIANSRVTLPLYSRISFRNLEFLLLIVLAKHYALHLYSLICVNTGRNSYFVPLRTAANLFRSCFSLLTNFQALRMKMQDFAYAE